MLITLLDELQGIHSIDVRLMQRVTVGSARMCIEKIVVAAAVHTVSFDKRLRVSIPAAFAFTLNTAFYTCVVAFAVLFLAPRFLAVASFIVNEHFFIVLIEGRKEIKLFIYFKFW